MRDDGLRLGEGWGQRRPWARACALATPAMAALAAVGLAAVACPGAAFAAAPDSGDDGDNRDDGDDGNGDGDDRRGGPRGAFRFGMDGQLRWRAGDAVDDPATTSDEGDAPPTREITLRRLRLRGAFRRGDLRGKLIFAADRGKPRLLTAVVRRDLGRHLRVELGQTKRLLGQSYLDGSAHQRLIERPRLAEEFAGERDIGSVLSLRGLDRRLCVAVAAWNGAGPNVVGNRTGALLGELRVDAQLIGRLDPEAPELGKRLGLRLAAAGAYGRQAAERSSGMGLLTRYDGLAAASATAALRWQRVELRGEVLWQRATPVDAREAPATALGLPVIRQLGLWVQLAVQPLRRWQLAARLERHQRDLRDADSVDGALDVALSYRPQRDDMRKLQLGWQRRRLARPQGATLEEDRAEVQLQWRL